MFSSGMKINGVELPADFNGASIINGIAISRDGSQFAYVTKGKDLITGDIPEDGRIQVEGQVINVKKGADGGSVLGDVSIGGSFSGSSVISASGINISGSGGSIVIGGGAELQEIDESYENVSRVDIHTKQGNIEVGVSEDDKVHFVGQVEEEPSVAGGTLIANGKQLSGKVLLPSGTDIELKLETKMGDISGVVNSAGNIETKMGSVSIVVQKPVSVFAETKMGSVNVVGMVSAGGGRYDPPSGNPSGVLRLSTKMGSVTVTYAEGGN